MAKETRRIVVEKEVEVCDRCKKYKGFLYTTTLLCEGEGLTSIEWTGKLCSACTGMIHRRIQSPAKRKGK